MNSSNEDWKPADMSPFWQKLLGGFITLFFVLIALGMTYYALADPSIGGVIGSPLDRAMNKLVFILAVWIGVGVPLIGVWSAISDSIKSQQLYSVAPVAIPQTSIPEESLRDTAQQYRPSGTPRETSQVLVTPPQYETETKSKETQEHPDHSYQGEMPRRKRRDEDVGK